MGNVYSQSRPPEPTLTENELPDLGGKCYIVTGGNAGVGKELVKILYSKNAKVYIATRSDEKTTTAIDEIRQEQPSSQGSLHFLKLDLSDLRTIKPAADEFLGKEDRLDVLWNNAGVMTPGKNSPPTAQGHEIQIGTNCLGPFLFTQLLLPLLKNTAATAPRDSIRVAWAGSLVVDTSAPQYGVDMEQLENDSLDYSDHVQYAVTKTGNLFLAKAFATRLKEDGIINIAFNPGNLKSELQRHMPKPVNVAIQPILYDAKYGAYTELFCGFSPEIDRECSGDAYIIPWGRVSRPRNDIIQAMKPLSESGKNYAERFYRWCDRETAAFK